MPSHTTVRRRGYTSTTRGEKHPGIQRHSIGIRRSTEDRGKGSVTRRTYFLGDQSEKSQHQLGRKTWGDIVKLE
eukprot:2866077-Amphidinium_carterae.1